MDGDRCSLRIGCTIRKKIKYDFSRRTQDQLADHQRRFILLIEQSNITRRLLISKHSDSNQAVVQHQCKSTMRSLYHLNFIQL
jgi:hypothetical protein